MATVVITMKDVENEQVDINVEFDPPLDTVEDKDVTVAQVAAVAAMSYLTQVFFDEPEPEATQNEGAVADWENEGGAS